MSEHPLLTWLRAQRRRATTYFDRRAVAADDHLHQRDPRPSTLVRPANDVFLATNLHETQLGVTGRICYGRVVTALPLVHWYRVLLDEGGGDLPCCMISDSSLTILGVRDTAPLAPNSQVYVYKDPRMNYGHILGTVPDILQDGSLSFADWISQGGGSGFQREGYYAEALKLVAQEGGVKNWNAGRPVDATALEWGRMAETGVGISIDAFMAYLRVNEACGLFLFYHDALARLAGCNLDIRSAIHEITARDDEGEGQYYHGDTGYPWEALGAFQYGTPVSRAVSATDAQFSQPYGVLEPQTDDQTAFHRYREYGGYLGQGRRREVVIPPYGLSQTALHRLSLTEPPMGVFREQIGYDGSYALASAKDVLIAKRVILPAPHRRKLPEDDSAQADNPQNYRSAGLNGSGPSHKVGDIAQPSDNAVLVTVCDTLDGQAYTFNWKGEHPFHYHEKDFLLPEEGAVGPFTALQDTLNFNVLSSDQFLPQAAPKTVTVDHRYGDVKYYQTLSMVHLTEDGGVSISDGYGAEIKMAGGHIYLSAPGDIIMQPGRNAVVLGGRDVVLRARNSLDLSATSKDVRIKAENNMQLLAGNSGYGGVLVESKASYSQQNYVGKVGEDVVSSGVVLKATNSQVVGWGNQVYLRTGAGNENGGSGNTFNAPGGPIVLDADSGNAQIYSISSQFTRFLGVQARDVFGINSPQAINIYGPNKNAFSGGLLLGNALTILQGGILAQGNILAIGQIGSSANLNGQLGVIEGVNLSDDLSILDNQAEELQQLLSNSASDYQDQIAQQFYAAGQIGNSDVQKSLGFSFRNLAQYRTKGFKIPEAYWQQLASKAGAGTVWKENPVSVNNQELMPWPGTEKWRDEETLLSPSFTMFDPVKGLDKARQNGPYESPTYGDWSTAEPDKSYRVID